ncbi:MAG: hypothetical protein EPO21_05195 [Chloroflexota bacterium]|nr:MAG: hypothetical protein EPO21_05195 [Chloroflexota bacterium]
MSLNVILPLLSTVVSLIFAGSVFVQFLSRRRPYQAVWTIGLTWYAGGSLMRLLVGLGAWDVLIYRIWYLCGAVFVAAYLGMGTVYLLAPRRVAHIVMTILGLSSILAAYLVLTAPVNVAALKAGELGTGVFPSYVAATTAIFNTFGAGAMIIGALYSAWVLWRKRQMPGRVVSNILIAAGAMIASAGGAFQRAGFTDAPYVFEFVAVVCIFAGFLANYEVIASRFALKVKPV